MTVKPVTGDTENLLEIEGLYLAAFPENERVPFGWLYDGSIRSMESHSFYEAGAFCGFAALVSHGDITQITYLAVCDGLRGKGIGGEILRQVRRMKPQSRILADLELEASGVPNNDQRRRRREFYLRNGYLPTDIRYRWAGESYEMLAQGGAVTEAEYRGLWKSLREENPGFSWR